jgi:hypothetical protein
MPAYLKVLLCVLVAAALPVISQAAESVVPAGRGPVVVTPQAPTVAPAPVVGAPVESTIIVQEQAPIRPPHVVRYGCTRVWRCDSVICEWRRGCWGVYGYMEGPYYNVDLAKRQWDRHGWASPTEYRARASRIPTSK